MAAMVAPTEDERRRRRDHWKHTGSFRARSLVETAMSRTVRRTRSRRQMRSIAGRRAEIYTLIAMLNRDAARSQPVRYRRAWIDGWPTTRAA